MNIQREKMAMIATIISFVANVIAIINIIINNYNMIFYISLFCVFFASVLLSVYWIKDYPILKRYKFIRFLFLEIRENKFNIVPKVLLFLDLMKKRNQFEVEKLSVIYDITEKDGIIDLNILWRMEEVSNVKSSDFYFYSGVDLGTIKNQKFAIYCNGIDETINLLRDNIISRNRVYLYHWDIPSKLIKRKNKIDKIELSMNQYNGFDFERKEVIYFFPWNFAKKINSVQFNFAYPISLGEISIQLFEAGKIKGEKYPNYTSLTTISEEKRVDTEKQMKIYEFMLERENINMDNLYYILIHKDS